VRPGPERAFTLDVTRDGFVVVQGVGEIQAANLTLGQLDDELYTKLGRVYSGLRRGADATTHFSVTVARMHANQVYVLGDVAQPGNYRISGAGTALTALYAAGGPTAIDPRPNASQPMRDWGICWRRFRPPPTATFRHA